MLEAFRSIRPWQIAVIVIVLLATVGGTYGGLLLIRDNGGAQLEEDQQLIPVQRGDLVNEVSINGSLLFPDRDTMRFGVQGTIGKVLLEEGDQVAEGQLLVTLDEETVTNLEKAVAQARVNLRDTEDAVTVLQSPASAIDLAQAEANVANAKVAHTAAAEALTALLETDPRDLALKELAVANATVALEDAADALVKLLEPPTSQALARAESSVTGAKLALQNAEDTLDSLLNATAEDIARSETAVADAKLSLQSAEEALDGLLNPTAEEMAKAESSVTDAERSLQDADDALKVLLKPTAEDMAKAESSVTDAKRSLQNAQDGLDSLLNPTAQQIAEAEAAVTRAKLVVANASTTLLTLEQGPDDDDVAEAQLDVDLAKATLAGARVDLELTNKEWADKVEASVDSVDASLADYREVFLKWLGVDLSDEETEKDTDALLASWEVDLAALFDPGARFAELRQLFSTAGPVDDPATRWDDGVVISWVNFFPGEIVASCESGSAPFQGVCIEQEMSVAWDALDRARAQFDTVELQAQKAISNAETIVIKSDDSVANAEDRLAALTAAPDTLDIETAAGDVELALLALQTREEELAALAQAPDSLDVAALEIQVALASARLETVKADLAALEGDPNKVEVEAKRNQVALASARLETAKVDLAALQGDPDELEVESKKQQVVLAAARLDTAKADLAELKGDPDPVEVEAKNKQIALAKADLDTAEEDLAELKVDPDAAEVEARNKQIALAQADLDKAKEDLAALIGGSDPLELDASRKQLSVTLAKLGQTEEDLAELEAGPDTLELRLREADMASARASLEVALLRLEDAFMIAPWDGIVTLLNVEAGDSVNPNTPVLEIVDPTVVEVDGIVDEIDVLFIRRGASALVTMDALPGQTLNGTVSEVASEAVTQQGVVSYPMRIRLQPPEGVLLPEGLSAVASVVIREERGVLLLPLQTLQGTFDEPVVLVMQSGSVTEQPVILGASDGFWVVIESGLVETELVVMESKEASTQSGFAALRGLIGGGFGRGGFRPGGGGQGGGRQGGGR